MARPCELVGKPLTCSGKLCENTIYGNIKGQKVYYFDSQKFFKGSCWGDFIGGTRQCNFEEQAQNLPYVPTGYKSSKGLARCLPATWTENDPYKAAKQGICNGYRYITLAELQFNACANVSNGEFADFQRREDFCNSLVDKFNNRRKPVSCGGGDPDILDLSASDLALDRIGGEVEKKTAEAREIADKAIMENRKKALVIFMLLMLLLIIIFVF